VFQAQIESMQAVFARNREMTVVAARAIVPPLRDAPWETSRAAGQTIAELLELIDACSAAT
jgi:prophage DNA circulation protein